ncbi:hypothetical protein F4801DRAFT_587346 [Xylaria longipes]|nr:hypothetical protein F4801DRAFT_587346 [Xylaria longipes]
MGGTLSKSAAPTTYESLRKAGPEVLEPADAEYANRQASYWSNSAKLLPSCIVRPGNAAEVATTIKILVAVQEIFAVRSGGHTQWAGSNNIEQGVTIDLGRLSWTCYDAESETVDIGPGGRWHNVYGELAKHGRSVAGGREGNVGVAGLILGSGNTFYKARHGFACDNVVAFEVVLADGRIVTARADDDATDDLFWALKGRSGNFGIVTNFRMRALKSGTIWGGLTFFPRQVTAAAAQALVDFTEGIHQDVDSNLLCFFAYTGDTCQMTTMPKLVSAPQNNLPTDYYNIWFTATFKNDVRIVNKAAELHEAMVDELKVFISDGDFWTQCLFQPLPKLFGERSAAAGGNAMGVERQSVDGLLFQAAAMVRTPEQETFVYPKIKAWITAVKDFAATIDGGLLEWTYLNYADKSQDPLASYGKQNVKKLQGVAMKYDPGKVFQHLSPGGFKISQVKTC